MLNKIIKSNFRHFVKNQNVDIATRQALSWDPSASVCQLLYDSSRRSMRSGFGHGPTLQMYNKMTTKKIGRIFTKLQILIF